MLVPGATIVLDANKVRNDAANIEALEARFGKAAASNRVQSWGFSDDDEPSGRHPECPDLRQPQSSASPDKIKKLSS